MQAFKGRNARNNTKKLSNWEFKDLRSEANKERNVFNELISKRATSGKKLHFGVKSEWQNQD
jgi:hypothetical protein